jgi:RNA polymerase sigma factor (sigma-70 family)
VGYKMIHELIVQSQEGDEDSFLTLIEKFNPLLKKYAYKLHYEDAYNDLLADFIELITHMQTSRIRNKNEGALVSYICTVIHSSYVKKLIAIKKRNNLISFSSLSENESYYVEVASTSNDEYFKYEIPGMQQVLTKSEAHLIELIFYSGYSASEIALVLGISRQV